MSNIRGALNLALDRVRAHMNDNAQPEALKMAAFLDDPRVGFHKTAAPAHRRLLKTPLQKQKDQSAST